MVNPRCLSQPITGPCRKYLGEVLTRSGGSEPSPSLAVGDPRAPASPGVRSLPGAQSAQGPQRDHESPGSARAGAAAVCADGDSDRDGSSASPATGLAVLRPGCSGSCGAGQPVKYTGGPCALRQRAVWKGNCPTRWVPQPGPAPPQGWKQRALGKLQEAGQGEAGWPSTQALPAGQCPPSSALSSDSLGSQDWGLCWVHVAPGPQGCLFHQSPGHHIGSGYRKKPVWDGGATAPTHVCVCVCPCTCV